MKEISEYIIEKLIINKNVESKDTAFNIINNYFKMIQTDFKDNQGISFKFEIKEDKIIKTNKKQIIVLIDIISGSKKIDFSVERKEACELLSALDLKYKAPIWKTEQGQIIIPFTEQ